MQNLLPGLASFLFLSPCAAFRTQILGKAVPCWINRVGPSCQLHYLGRPVAARKERIHPLQKSYLLAHTVN